MQSRAVPAVRNQKRNACRKRALRAKRESETIARSRKPSAFHCQFDGCLLSHAWNYCKVLFLALCQNRLESFCCCCLARKEGNATFCCFFFMQTPPQVTRHIHKTLCNLPECLCLPTACSTLWSWQCRNKRACSTFGNPRAARAAAVFVAVRWAFMHSSASLFCISFRSNSLFKIIYVCYCLHGSQASSRAL